MVGVRMVSPPTLYCPPERYLILAASFTIYAEMVRGYPYEEGLGYLVECGEYIVSKLYLGDGGVAHEGQTDTEACDTLLGQRCVEHALTTWRDVYFD